jgi:hypothetical protein
VSGRTPPETPIAMIATIKARTIPPNPPEGLVMIGH